MTTNTFRKIIASVATSLAAIGITVAAAGAAHAEQWENIDYFGSMDECLVALDQHRQVSGAYARYRCEYTGEANPWADIHLQGSNS
ncbi:hypothetical protein ACFXNW_09965 [Nocardia sp. NPDC059180]|uniref:hypothetical protein n=1 Tax=Nocardia sp. NPDC059180 TaxID=3346761 RepID=UPI0036B618B7